MKLVKLSWWCMKAAAATAAVASELAHSKSQGGLLDRIGLGFLARFGLAF